MHRWLRAEPLLQQPARKAYQDDSLRESFTVRAGAGVKHERLPVIIVGFERGL